MIGNVWEWTDGLVRRPWRRCDAAPQGRPGAAARSPIPAEATREASIDPSSQHGTIPRKVVKGGSFLCAPSYCRRYRPAARMAQGIDTSTCHMGFRCIVRVTPLP